MHKGVVYALLAAATFGASTPFSKMLVGQIAPVTLAGLLYLGSGLGLLVWFVIRAVSARSAQDASARLTRQDLPWLGGAIIFGGIAGPVLLMVGLTLTPASSASLLLNMEGVLTSLLAWFVFRENFDRRIFLGMVLIVAGGVVLSWGERPELGVPWGAIAIVAACLCWAIDNNLTRKISASDAVQIAGIKGLVAGAVNLSIAWVLALPMPALPSATMAAVVGFCGYGLSLVLFVLALRNLGTARTGAYFSAAPFVGAAISLAMLGEAPGGAFWLASALMGAGIWLHLTEKHDHLHTHEAMAHSHRHVHDEHHRHEHDFAWDGTEPHAHPHRHAPMTHAHSHYPDIHHQHKH
ncbi:MAG TPA: EamA family transporter [Oxalobacteraceae bacterium]|nr:EamA family transporter [Oxalobacteraceae bacterium]